MCNFDWYRKSQKKKSEHANPNILRRNTEQNERNNAEIKTAAHPHHLREMERKVEQTEIKQS